MKFSEVHSTSKCTICKSIRLFQIILYGTKRVEIEADTDKKPIHFMVNILCFRERKCNFYKFAKNLKFPRFNTRICIHFRITLRSMRSKCDGQRKSLTVQLNSRPVRRIELIRKFVLQ